MAEAVSGVLFMHIFRAGSRNGHNNGRREANFRKNIFRYFGIALPHADSSDDVLRQLLPDELETLKAYLVSGLIEQKIFRKFRLLGKNYLIAVDATGIATFDKKHCEHCLMKTSKNGVITYFHYVLEAKLVTSSGFAISIASEFVENLARRDYDKQDCEQKAFQEEVVLLMGTSRKLSVCKADRYTRTTLDYKYLNNIEYDGRNFSWVECHETIYSLKGSPPVETRFVYITNISQSNETVVQTANMGRLRWKIENEGFNTQKNLGYELAHKFSRTSYTAMQNYYRLMQIAHMIVQLVERAREVIELKEEHSKQTWIDLWKKTVYSLMFCLFEPLACTHIEPG